MNRAATARTTSEGRPHRNAEPTFTERKAVYPMDFIECRTQADLDAVKAGDIAIVRSGHFTAYGSSTVTAYGSSTVTAYDSSTVTAYDSSTVTAYDSSTVTAYDSSTVTAYDSSTVTATDSSTVTAYDSSTVTAYDSSTVTAYGSSTVTAYGSSTVTAYGSSTVTATKGVPIHVGWGDPTITGGAIILRRPDLDSCDAATWLDWHGVTTDETGTAVLFKAVDDDWTTGRGPEWTYKPGNTVTARDFTTIRECGGGLHLGATPVHATKYHSTATRWVAVAVTAADIVPLGDKAKVRSCRVLHEVTLNGERVTA